MLEKPDTLSGQRQIWYGTGLGVFCANSRGAMVHLSQFAVRRQQIEAVIGDKQRRVGKPNGRFPGGGGCVHSRILMRQDGETNTRHKSGVDGGQAAT